MTAAAVLFFLVAVPAAILALRWRFKLHVGLLLAFVASLDAWLLIYLAGRIFYDAVFL